MPQTHIFRQAIALISPYLPSPPSQFFLSAQSPNWVAETCFTLALKTKGITLTSVFVRPNCSGMIWNVLNLPPHLTQKTYTDLEAGICPHLNFNL